MPVPAEKSWVGGREMRTASLTVLDAGSSSGEKEAIRKAAVRHLCK